ncbi:MAG: hypothetical protein Q4C00_02995 [Bacillota bacterium]|nr:hypothetical protein [Bacillota bacterium]
MKILNLCVRVLVGIFSVTILFTILNAWNILGYRTMETVWLFYPGFVALICSYFFSCSFNVAGGGIFFAFCFIGPAVVISYYLSLPWGDFFFRPFTMIVAGIFSILGEAFNLRKRSESHKR